MARLTHFSSHYAATVYLMSHGFACIAGEAWLADDCETFARIGRTSRGYRVTYEV